LQRLSIEPLASLHLTVAKPQAARVFQRVS
jgi:hypothetical protein